VLSFAAALGLSALLFHALGFHGADPSLPLDAFVFLVALGIDYNIFLMTRVREETRRSGTRQGMLTALAATGGVITSAGLVLAATFSALTFDIGRRIWWPGSLATASPASRPPQAAQPVSTLEVTGRPGGTSA